MPTSNQKETPTMYFKVDKNLPDTEDLIGDRNGELLNLGYGIISHLAMSSDLETGGLKKLSKEGRGDIVVEKISNKAWDAIINIFDNLEPGMTSVEIANKITSKLYWIR